MALYKISDQSVTMNLKPSRDIGNSRNSIAPKPPLKPSDYTSCIYNVFPFSGNIISLRNCREKTEAWHGAQFNKDIMINNSIILR
jgi:hypothetical protein